MFYFVCLEVPFTHGEDGIQGVPRGTFLGLVNLDNNLAFYFVVLAIVAAGHFAIWRIVHSPFGNILKAIRDNEPRAISLGYNVDSYKLRAFVLSAGLAGLAGGTHAIVYQLATLTDVEWQASGQVILMTLLGGIGTLAGPPIGAAIVVLLQTNLAALDFPVTVLIGLIFVVCVLLFRRGVAGEIIAYTRKRG
jgi:branched-chain amino acid transport system permease protein